MTRHGAPLFGSLALLAALGAAAYRQANPPWDGYQPGLAQVRSITPTLSGEPELCLTCHEGIEEISSSHPVESFGCVSCHGGERLSLDVEGAHANLIGGKNPADLAVVEVGCGGSDCHTGDPSEKRDHITRVQRGVQSTYAGAINGVLTNFNLQHAGDPLYGAHPVTDDAIVSDTGVAALLAFDPAAFASPIPAQFADACLTCHLGAEPLQAEYYYRGTGCAACHTPYNQGGLYAGGDPTIPRDEPGHAAQHRLTLEMPYTQCNHCHNRGNYSLARMEFLPRDDLASLTDLPPEQRRPLEYYQPIGQFTLCEWELDCIDCHTSNEAMGDGDIHTSQADAQSVQCKTCHGTLDEPPELVAVTEPDDPAIRRARLNPHYTLEVGDVAVLAPDGDVMGAVQLIDGQLVQFAKAREEVWPVPLVQGSACEQGLDQQESRYCHECHAYDPQRP
jgi:hypothetical protein